MTMSTFGMNDDDEMWCNDVPYFDGDSGSNGDSAGDGDLDQWEYLLQTFDTLPAEAAAPQETTEVSPAAMMILNSAAAAAAAAHECEVTLKKSNSSPQTVVEPIDDILDGFTHQTPNAEFCAAKDSSLRRSVLWDGRSTDKSRNTTEVHSKDTAFRPLGRTGQQHVLTSDWIALRNNVESRPPPPPPTTTPVPHASFCGMHSLCSAPTLDPVSTLGNSLFPDALHYVFTPRIAEMLQSNDWSSSSSASLLTSSSANSTLLEGNQSPKSMSQSGPVKARSAHKAFPKQRSHQRPPCQPPRRPTVCLPLTAYNYFYRHERDTIVQGMTHANDPLPPSVWDFTSEKKAELLHQHWYVIVHGACLPS
jgi:hypothetical protein